MIHFIKEIIEKEELKLIFISLVAIKIIPGSIIYHADKQDSNKNNNLQINEWVYVKNIISNASIYKDIWSNGTFLLNKKFTKSKTTKIPIVLAVYSGEYFIRALRSIQNQYFNDLEIILINENPLIKNNKIILENEKKKMKE